jgi:hypothetical protein
MAIHDWPRRDREVKQVRLYLTKPQEQFVFSSAIHPGMVAGYGAGKSQAAAIRIALLAMQYQGMNFGFVEPTFDLVRLIAWPRFASLFDDWEVPYELNKSESVMRLGNGSQIIFRSADNPERMVGFEIADGVIDEADTLKAQHASEVWTKMLGRCRQKKPDGKPNTLGAVSTPEGFGWMYETFGKELKPGYELIRAPSSSNPYLPDGYLDQLRATYSSAQLQAYLDGEFVNLSTGSVYPDFDRALNLTDETVREGEPLHVGMDFNVMNGAAVVFVLRGGNPVAVDEVTKTLDTPQMISVLKRKFAGHAVYVYPDASGSGRRSNDASATDLALLRQAGFTVLVNSTNPAVKDRVLSVNAMIRLRKLLVNPDRCPSLVESFEKQGYDKNGEPDKSTGLDHIVDAAGYFIAYKFPVARNTPTKMQIVGI